MRKIFIGADSAGYALKEEIKDYLTADPKYGHGNYTDNDAEYIQSPSGNFYRFELRVDGVDVKVDVSPDGTVTFAKYDF